MASSHWTAVGALLLSASLALAALLGLGPAPALAAPLTTWTVLDQVPVDLGYQATPLAAGDTPTARAAVERFQRTHGLPDTGRVTAATVHALTRAVDERFHPVASPLGGRLLRRGDRGGLVVTLQKLLAKADWYSGGVDGLFNRPTARAVRSAQDALGLPTSGVAGARLIGLLAAKHSGAEGSTASAPMTLGYYVPGPSAHADLLAHYRQITAIAPLWYSFAPDRRLHTLATGLAALTAWCRAHDVAVYPLVINGYGNDAMLQSATLLRRDVATLVALAADQHYSGFNIDFESLNNDDEAGLNAFVAKLAAGLHAEGKKLIVSVGPRTSNLNGYHAYDYASLGASANYVDLMTYDDHDNTGPVGPVAPLNWVRSIVRYATATIPPAKILVGLAGYGYEWASTGSTELNDDQALRLAAVHGAIWVGSPVDEPEIVWTSNGVQHIVWFEDSASEAYRAALVSEWHLGGVALWDLGEENAAVWPMLARVLAHEGSRSQ